MRRPIKAGILAAYVSAMALTGCVHRRLTSRTFPEGAMAYVDNQEIGPTPVSTGFSHYGVRTIRVERDGFETVEVDERIDAPWYLTPPLDFFVENFWPREIRDERVVDIEMQPLRNVPRAEIEGRAQQLRQQSQQGVVVPFAPTATR